MIRNGKKIKVLPFSDYKKEKIEGIETENYLAEGLDSLLYSLKVKNMSYRVLRPLGFHNFFKYLENYGFFKKENIDLTKKILEEKKGDNLTFGEVKIKIEKKKAIWKLRSSSKKNEKLSSMQKISGILPVVLARTLLEKDFYQRGLLFLEKLGEDKNLFNRILKEVKKEISITRLTKNQ